MRLIKIISVAIVAVLAVAAMATGAYAHEFEASKTGLLTATAHSPQLFRFPAGEVICNTLIGHGNVVALKTKTQVSTVQYKNCTTSLGGTVSEPINAEYEFNAEGTVSILKDITVTSTVAGAKCIVLVLPQANLKTITYTNVGNGILLASNIKGILSHGSGALCKWGDDKSGEYIGSALVALTGGVIKWV